MNRLNEGDLFPDMTLALAGGGQFSLPGDISTPYQVVLFYRGHW